MSDYNNDDIKNTEDEQKYEDVCYMCRRPESKTGRMLHIPGMNNMCICIDCMERSFRVMDGSNYADLMQGMNIQDIFPGGLNMDDMMNMQNQIPKKQKLKKKAKDGEEAHPEFDIKNIPAPHILKAKLDEFVIGQDQAKKAIAVAVYNHYKRVATNTMDDIEIEKSNILMIGPTGCGKTYLVKTLARLLDVPLAITDATSLTEAGYIGDDIESVVSKLLAAADNDTERAERGIIFIDEIDKIAKKKNTTARDVSGESVQQGLLKLLEGSEVEVPVGATSKNAMVPLVTIDTRNILFICGGAFDGLEKIIENRIGKKSIGFQAEIMEQRKKDVGVLLKQVLPEDFVKFGLIPEFIGRVPVNVSLNPLDKDALVKILTEPKSALVKQYQKLFEMDGVELKFTDDALEAIAEKAIARNTGARGLRSIMESVVMDLMYTIPSDDLVESCTITKETVDGSGEPELTYHDQPVTKKTVTRKRQKKNNNEIA